jgi:hypothetical protein
MFHYPIDGHWHCYYSILGVNERLITTLNCRLYLKRFFLKNEHGGLPSVVDDVEKGLVLFSVDVHRAHDQGADTIQGLK